MPNIHCPHCGGSTKYLYQKPEECPYCDKSFVIAAPKVRKPIRKVVELDEDGEDEELEEVRSHKPLPKLKKFKIDLGPPALEKLGEVLGTDPDGNNMPKRRSVSLEEFKSKMRKTGDSEVEAPE